MFPPISIPRWFKLVVVVEVLAAIAVGVLAVRLVLGGAQVAGQVYQWARPHLDGGAAPPPAVPMATATANPVTAQQLGNLQHMSGPFLDRLDKDAATTATGELRLIQALEGVIRERVTRAIDGPGHR